MNISSTFYLRPITKIPICSAGSFLSGISGWGDQIIGGWHISGIAALQSVSPFSPTVGDRANTGVGSQRADVIGAPIMPDTVGCWFYTSANSACKGPAS
jgi:hypothetical protein